MNITLFAKLTVPAEGERSRVYDDATGKTIGPGTLVKGNPTIGIGRNVGPTGPGLRNTEMFAMLENDEGSTEKDAGSFPWYGRLSQTRQTVVCCMIFNMGLEKFSGFHNLIGALKEAVERDGADAQASYQLARDQMLMSKWSQPPPIGVGVRATVLAQIMLDDHE